MKPTDSHQRILDFMGVKDLTTLVDKAFLEEFGLQMPNQYGVVCEDVRKNLLALEELGSEPFVYAITDGPNWHEYGVPREVKIELALGYSNDQQIELLGAGENTSLYSDYIPNDGTTALHHVCVFQQEIEELEQRLNSAGYQTVISGHIGTENIYTTKFRYLDTRSELGFYLELCEYEVFGRHAPPGPKIIGSLGRLQRIFNKR